MGGYGALRFALVLKVQRMLGISPQVFIDRSLGVWGKRYHAEAQGWDGCLGALAGRGTNVRGAVLVDPFKPLDLRALSAVHAGYVAQRRPSGHAGHEGGRTIRSAQNRIG